MSKTKEMQYVGNGWTIQSYDGQYLYVVKEGKPGIIQIKADDEGFVVDIFTQVAEHDGSDPVASACAEYSELEEV
ncbi:hypothetical protein UFOVP26_35 [uncultured Caudovirales phage]|uniref:Uncharacterized protein n=1 Tax=uncultured Caudovirales phage TaxID=2100421 RepID=A0A6J5KIC6_9CAUD|nr:hypothetical protein UFOVP26_35 [uncultured Caudovirales phage]CAB4123822.1 hypothetical protein UFOVP44_62 [uncultured Caudovirales phage]CAB5219257.1 hypothetical protein UFOVP220_53 [uncultured Caudovirales phage]